MYSVLLLSSKLNDCNGFLDKEDSKRYTDDVFQIPVEKKGFPASFGKTFKTRKALMACYDEFILKCRLADAGSVTIWTDGKIQMKEKH